MTAEQLDLLAPTHTNDPVTSKIGGAEGTRRPRRLPARHFCGSGQGGEGMSAEPTYLNPAKVGAAVVRCPGCGEERWYGYGACGACGTYLPSEPKPGLGWPDPNWRDTQDEPCSCSPGDGTNECERYDECYSAFRDAQAAASA